MPEEWAQKAASGDGLSLGSVELLGLPVDHWLAKLEEKENRNTKSWTGELQKEEVRQAGRGVKREGTEVPVGTRSWRRHHPSCPTLSSPRRSPQACRVGNASRGSWHSG